MKEKFLGMLAKIKNIDPKTAVKAGAIAAITIVGVVIASRLHSDEEVYMDEMLEEEANETEEE